MHAKSAFLIYEIYSYKCQPMPFSFVLNIQNTVVHELNQSLHCTCLG